MPPRSIPVLPALLVLGVSSTVLVGAAVLAPSNAAAAAPVTITGHGYGHGRGLGQWGSYGYAVNSGWSWQQITDHYYGGTTLGSIGVPQMKVRLTAFDGATTFGVTNASAFWVGGPGQSFRVPGGQTAWITSTGDTFSATVSDGACGGTTVQGATALPAVTNVEVENSSPADPSQLLTMCSTKVGYRGIFHVLHDAGATRVVNELDVDSYLRGVVPRESPASWGDAGGGRGMNALAAQAVAARSYSLAEGRYSYAKTCDSDSCQVYGGAARNGSWIEDARSNQAIAMTSGAVRLNGAGAIARTEFSSSTGGYTAGGTFPAVPDDGDSAAPYHNWSTTLAPADIAAKYPSIGTFTSVDVTGRNGLGADGGRVTQVQVVGTAGTVTATGSSFANAFGLRSDWFSTKPAAANLAWYVRNEASTGASATSFSYGFPDSTRLSCDMNGDGRSDVVLFSGGFWYIHYALTTGVADLTISYGAPGDTPVCGDWTGSGRMGIGVYRPGVFYLRDTVTTGVADRTVGFGNPGDLPVVGKWVAGQATALGVFRPSSIMWYLASRPNSNAVDISFAYGFPGAVPVPADYAGTGTSQVGLYSKGIWYLRHDLGTGVADNTFAYGNPDDTPLVGDWDGDGKAGIGITRPY